MNQLRFQGATSGGRALESLAGTQGRLDGLQVAQVANASGPGEATAELHELTINVTSCL